MTFPVVSLFFTIIWNKEDTPIALDIWFSKTLLALLEMIKNVYSILKEPFSISLKWYT